MKLSLAQKLFTAFLGLTLVVLAATLGLARWSFERGFLDYINTRERQRLEWTRDILAKEYESSGGNWESMTSRNFSEILNFAQHLPDDDNVGDRPAPPPPGRGGPDSDFFSPHSPPDHPPGPRSPPAALYDQNNQFITGSRINESVLEPIRVAIVVQGKTVGELVTEPRRQLSSPQDSSFSRGQLNVSWIIGITSLLLAAALSLVLTRGLLAPIKRMATNVTRLSSGDYSARLQESRNDELGALMADLDHLGMTLEKERLSRRQWLADISHEMRTPLTILAGELEALRDGVRRFDVGQIESLDQEVRRLRFLIDDLYELSLSDVGGLRYSFATLNLTDSIKAAISARTRRANDNGLALSLEADDDILINGDINRIDQLFQNLFENSFAYTDAPGSIDVTLSRRNEFAVLEIHDTAPGASEIECGQLFEPFYRREASRSRREGGAGLGLAICRNIVEAHRGTITASPSPRSGLYIHIEIPAVTKVKS